ncbi:MAG: ADOP family duplicated permease [Vicinamibacterales bacterium]
MSAIAHDVRLAFRHLRHRPGLTLAVSLTLAVGIAVAVVAFAVVNAAFLRPPDVAAPDRLVNLYTTRPDGTAHVALSYPDYEDLRAATTAGHATATGAAFADLAGYSGLLATWSHEGRADTLFGEIVTGSYFPTLGIRPALGRLLTPDDDLTPGRHPVVVLGHAFWRNRLAGDPAVVGQSITLNGRPYTVVGVAPASFTGSLFRGFSVDVWAPTMMMGALRKDELANRDERWLFVRARLADGASLERATSAIDAVAARLAADHPDSNRGRRFVAAPTSRVWFSPDADTGLTVLSVLLVGSCLLVLGVGTSNVTGLLAARLVGRSRDLALHTALGATRGRLFRQLLAEAMLIAATGGATGLALAAMASRAISTFRPPLPVPLAFDVRVDWRVAAFAASLAFGVALLLSLASLRQLARRERAAGVRAALAGTTPLTRSRRHWLLVPQIAGSTVLLVLAALGARSVTAASRVDPGFDVAHAGFLAFDPGTSGLDEAASRRFFEALTTRALETPGVVAAAVADRMPLDLYGSRSVGVSIEGGSVDGGRRAGESIEGGAGGVQAAAVTGGYFDALGIPITAGRTFDVAALRGPSDAVIVSASFVRRYWPSGPALGRTLTVDGRRRTVVGVVADVKVATLGEPPTAMVYVPLSEGYAGLRRVIVRTTGDPREALAGLAGAAAGIRPDVALFEQRPMREHVGLLLLPFALASWLGAGLGVIAVALAAVGLHGLVAFAVAARTREFGVRVALGATRWQLAGTAARETTRATIAGLALGLVAAAGAARMAATFVTGVAPLDPVSFATGAVATLLVAAAAAPDRCGGRGARIRCGRCARTDRHARARAQGWRAARPGAARSGAARPGAARPGARQGPARGPGTAGPATRRAATRAGSLATPGAPAATTPRPRPARARPTSQRT